MYSPSQSVSGLCQPDGIDFSSALCDLDLGLQAARDLRDGELDQYLSPTVPTTAASGWSLGPAVPAGPWNNPRHQQHNHHHHHHHHPAPSDPHGVRYHELQPPTAPATKVERTTLADSPYHYPYLPTTTGVGNGGPSSGGDSWWTGCF